MLPMSELDTEVKEAMLKVKDSKVRQVILTYLQDAPFSSPTEILEHVETTTDVSRSSFYDNLEVLRDEELVTRIGGSGRATMYELSELGKEVLDKFELDGQDKAENARQANTVDEEIDRLLETYDFTAAELIKRIEKQTKSQKR